MDVVINGARYVPESISAIPATEYHVLIKQAREAASETLEEAARAIETSKSYLWEMEQGKCQPTLATLQRVLKHYGLKFEQIAL